MQEKYPLLQLDYDKRNDTEIYTEKKKKKKTKTQKRKKKRKN